MAIVKRPPESVTGSLRLDQPASELLEDYARFVDGNADYVALWKTLGRDPDYKKWKASRGADGSGKRPPQPAGK